MIAQTDRLLLRRLRAEDAAALEAVLGDAEVMRYSMGVLTQAEIFAWLREQVEGYARRGFGPWAVVLRQTGGLIGYCGLFQLPDVGGLPAVEIGYRLARSSWGHGYATEAVCAVRDYAFASLGLTRLIALIDPANTASIRVAEKAGMVYERAILLPGYSYPDHLYGIERG